MRGYPGHRPEQGAVDGGRSAHEAGQLVLGGLSALVTLICAAIILSTPFVSGQALWIFTGVSLLAEVALDMLALLWKGKAPAQPAEKEQRQALRLMPPLTLG